MDCRTHVFLHSGGGRVSVHDRIRAPQRHSIHQLTVRNYQQSFELAQKTGKDRVLAECRGHRWPRYPPVEGASSLMSPADIRWQPGADSIVQARSQQRTHAEGVAPQSAAFGGDVRFTAIR